MARRRDLDLTLLYNLASTPSLNAEPLVRERLWVVAPPSAGLRAEQAVPFREAAVQPMVMPAVGHGLRTLVDAAAVRAEVEVNVAVQTNSMHVQKQLVRAGHGWTILPGVGIAEDVGKGFLSAAPLCDPDVWRTIVLGTSRAGRMPAAAVLVAKEVTRQIRDAVREGRWPSAQLPDQDS